MDMERKSNRIFGNELKYLKEVSKEVVGTIALQFTNKKTGNSGKTNLLYTFFITKLSTIYS